MFPSSDSTRRRLRHLGVGAAVAVVAIATPTSASALPPPATAAVVAFETPVVIFSGGTADLDGSTTLENTETGTKSRLDCTLLFAKDSDRLRPGAQQKLRRLALQLQRQGAGQLQITGYTDDLGSAAHGLDLSQRRAQRVATELGNTLPANKFPMTVRGRGEADPAVLNTNENNRRKNRRVNVTLTRTQSAPARTSTTHSTGATVAPTSHPTAATAQQPTALPSPTSAYTTSRPTLQAQVDPTRQPAPKVPPPPAPSRPNRQTWPLIAALSTGLIAVGAFADLIRRRRAAPPSQTAPPAAPPDPDLATDAQAAPASTDRGRPDTDTSPSPQLAAVADKAQATNTHPARDTAGLKPDRANPNPSPPTGKASARQAGHGTKLDDDLAAWSATNTNQPRLTLLGPVHASTRGQALARRKPYYTELLAYLTLKPHGATADEMADTFNLTTARVRTDMKILRDWLGADPTTSQPYLPDARTSPAAHQRGLPTYQVRGVLCDWLLFTQLQTRAATTKPANTSDLEAALKLVTGRPFTSTRTNGWGWIFEGRRIDLHATTAIITVANSLAQHHEADGNDTAAQHALAIASVAESD